MSEQPRKKRSVEKKLEISKPVGRLVFSGSAEFKAQLKNLIKLNDAGDKYTINPLDVVAHFGGEGIDINALYPGIDFSEPVDATYLGEAMMHDKHKLVINFGADDVDSLPLRELLVENSDGFSVSISLAVQ